MDELLIHIILEFTHTHLLTAPLFSIPIHFTYEMKKT